MDLFGSWNEEEEPAGWGDLDEQHLIHPGMGDLDEQQLIHPDMGDENIKECEHAEFGPSNTAPPTAHAHRSGGGGGSRARMAANIREELLRTDARIDILKSELHAIRTERRGSAIVSNRSSPTHSRNSPGSPFSPYSTRPAPASPCSPCSPASPCSPCSPASPAAPASPKEPCEELMRLRVELNFMHEQVRAEEAEIADLHAQVAKREETFRQLQEFRHREYSKESKRGPEGILLNKHSHTTSHVGTLRLALEDITLRLDREHEKLADTAVQRGNEQARVKQVRRLFRQQALEALHLGRLLQYHMDRMDAKERETLMVLPWYEPPATAGTRSRDIAEFDATAAAIVSSVAATSAAAANCPASASSESVTSRYISLARQGQARGGAQTVDGDDGMCEGVMRRESHASFAHGHRCSEEGSVPAGLLLAQSGISYKERHTETSARLARLQSTYAAATDHFSKLRDEVSRKERTL